MAALPSEFFSSESILTLAGATLLTTVITNSCQHAFNWNPKWLGLVVGMIIAIVGVAFTESPSPVNFVMGFFNGFLVYANATGIMQMAGKSATDRSQNNNEGLESFGPLKRRFSQKWY